jgi:hypothetical protein
MTDTKKPVEEVVALVLIALAAIFVLMLLSIFVIPFHALLLMLAWNYTLPIVFNLPNIGFLQALCLVIIARILIRSSNINSSK